MKQVSLDTTPLKCMALPLCWVMTLTIDLWPWKPCQQCALTWWVFVPGFTKERDIAAHNIDVNGRTAARQTTDLKTSCLHRLLSAEA